MVIAAAQASVRLSNDPQATPSQSVGLGGEVHPAGLRAKWKEHMLSP
jgi:hypothetical protein